MLTTLKSRKRYTRWFAESYDRRLDLYVRSKENGRLFYCCLLPVRYSLDRHWRPSDRLYCSTFAYLRLLLYGRPETYRLHAFRRIFSFSFYGLFAVSGTYWLQTHSFNWLTLVPGLSLGLIGAAILFVNNYRDLDHDRSVGRYTLVAACGRKLANTLYMLMISCPLFYWLDGTAESALLAVPFCSHGPSQSQLPASSFKNQPSGENHDGYVQDNPA